MQAPFECKGCGGNDLLYAADFILKASGTMLPDGTIDEPSDYVEKPLKFKIKGYSCMECDYETSFKSRWQEAQHDI